MATGNAEGDGGTAHGVISPSPEDRCIQITVADVPLATILVELQPQVHNVLIWRQANIMPAYAGEKGLPTRA